MGRICWVHLSDLHFGPIGRTLENYDRQQVLKHLWTDISARKEISPELECLDFAFVTGDLTASGDDSPSASEFGFFRDEVLASLTKQANLPLERVFVVPGNHDVALTAVRDSMLDAFLSAAEDSDIKSLFVSDEICAIERHEEPQLTYGAWRDRLFAGLSNYREFLAKLPHIRNALRAHSMFYSVLVEDSSLPLPVRIIGLNSAWLARGGDKDKGRLALGEPEVEAILQTIEAGELVISLVHHPLDQPTVWYRSGEGNLIQQIMTSSHFVLAGHLHESNAISQIGFSGGTHHFTAGAAYKNRDFSNSYSFVSLDTASGKGTIFFRRYVDRTGAGKGCFMADIQLTGEKRGGKLEFGFPPPRGELPADPPKGVDYMDVQHLGDFYDMSPEEFNRLLGEITGNLKNLERSAHGTVLVGLCRLYMRDFNEAISLFQTAIGRFPVAYDAYHYLGLAAMRGRRPVQLGMDDVREIERCLQNSIDRNSENPKPYFLWSLIKLDYYVRFNFRDRGPDFEELISKAYAHAIPKAECLATLDHLNIRDERIRTILLR